MDGNTQPTGSTTTGPASFSDASVTWADDSSASEPTASTTPAASASAETTSPPAEPNAPDGSPQQAGEPPKERWADILANARTKAAEEATAPLAWARDINPQEFQQIQQLARTLSANPIDGLQQLIAEVRKDPRYDAELKSLAARALAHGRQAAQPGPNLQPIQVQLDNGQTVGLYSAEQIAALRQQWMSEVEQKFSPVTQTIETLQAERAAAQQQQQVEHFVTTTYQDVATWPGMESKDAQAAVARELAAAKIDPTDPREVQIALHTAWRKVVVPTLGTQAEAKLLDSLKTKAAATSVNPGSAAASTPRGVTRFADLPKEAWG